MYKNAGRNSYNFFFFIICVKACMIPCAHQPPTRGDNTVSVAQGRTVGRNLNSSGFNKCSLAVL